MTEANQAAATNEQSASFDLRRVYLKDASLEMPNAPAIFLDQEQPKVNIEIAIETTDLKNNAYEVVVKATVSASHDTKTMFLVQADQAGVFEIVGVPETQLPQILNIVCPSMLFPYLRSNITDLMTRATLPPLYLAEMNFEQLYQHSLEQASQTKQ